MKLLFILAMLFWVGTAQATKKAQVLMAEYSNLQEWISSVEADGVIGGLYPYVQMDGYTISYSKSFDDKHDVIRIFKNHPAPKMDFTVTYIRSIYLARFPGRLVLRRFVGHEPTGWRNDTVDVKTGEDLGNQGLTSLDLDEEEAAILQEWNVTLF